MDFRPITPESIDDLGALLGTEKSAASCWCMWFISPVKAFHARGSSGNREALADIVESSSHPAGLLGYLDGAPAAWCAIGPRARYVRAVKTPTYRGADPAEHATVWFLPCLFVRRDLRGTGHSEALIRAAIDLAKTRGAAAVEAFPFATAKRRTNDAQVGALPTFERCGFRVIRRPSDARVVVRLDFDAAGGTNTPG